MPRHLQLSLMKSIQAFAVVILGLTAFATVQADPITVTGTATSVPGVIFGPSIVFNLTGQNFSANVRDDGGVDRFMHFGFWPCTIQAGSVTPCTTANAGYSSQSDLRGPFTINGQNFNASVIDSLNFQLTSPTFVIPAEFLDDGAILITAPFSFLGSASTQIGVTIQLDGQGTVRLLLTRQTVGDITGLFFERADYTFGQTVDGVTIESVPEPATLVLLFSGLAGVAARVKYRSRRLR
jgi:hypothetical protein